MAMFSTASAEYKCLDEHDVHEWESKNGKETFASDLGACAAKSLCSAVEDEKAKNCVNDCYVNDLGYDYTGDCQDCFGTMGNCVGHQCFVQCIGGVNDPCKKCIGEKCEEAFTGCSGISNTDFMAMLENIQVGDDYCINDNDEDKWDNGGGKKNFTADLGESAKSCTNEACYKDFYQKKYDYTEKCLGCFVNMDVCLKRDCLVDCLFGVNDKCTGCVKDKCGDAFTGCSGWSQDTKSFDVKGIMAKLQSKAKLLRKRILKD